MQNHCRPDHELKGMAWVCSASNKGRVACAEFLVPVQVPNERRTAEKCREIRGRSSEVRVDGEAMGAAVLVEASHHTVLLVLAHTLLEEVCLAPARLQH